ncbi:hypothetical protein L208DRAFT_1391377, partial [Tricholoma matsutake]
MAQYLPEEVGFLDETSKDERTLSRQYGSIKKAAIVHGRCTSTTGLLTLNGIEAVMAVEGSMMKEMYLEFLEFTVLPKCTAYPGLLSVLVMDNAKIHHSVEILELLDRF